MPNERNHHETNIVAPKIAEPIEVIRYEWESAMTTQIRVHITLVYPQEAPIVDLLAARLHTAGCKTPPFRLRLGTVAYFERLEQGIYIAVDDVTGGYRRLREH